MLRHYTDLIAPADEGWMHEKALQKDRKMMDECEETRRVTWTFSVLQDRCYELVVRTFSAVVVRFLATLSLTAALYESRIRKSASGSLLNFGLVTRELWSWAVACYSSHVVGWTRKDNRLDKTLSPSGANVLQLYRVASILYSLVGLQLFTFVQSEERTEKSMRGL